ncbi:MAG: tyrosine-type recombinase/integrase [Verrucomicrobiia bacterium]
MGSRLKTQTITVVGVPFKLTRLKRSRGGFEWRLRWYGLSGKRETKTYHREEDARQAAMDIREGLQAGRDLEHGLTGSARLLEDHRLVLEVARYCPREHLLEAALAWARAHGTIDQKTVEQVCVEFLTLKKAGGASARYIEDLEYRLPRISDAFPNRALQSLTGKDFDQFLVGLNLGQRSLYNFRLTLSALAGFARKRGYVAKDWTAVEDMALTGEKRVVRVEVFTPEEAGKLLKAAPSNVRHGLAMGFFTAMRTAEIQRLTWGAINLESRSIRLDAAVTKTGVGRVVTMPGNLTKWLEQVPEPERRRKFLKVADSTFINAMRRVSRQSGVPWKRNAMRHSGVSYRVALEKDLPQIAWESGHSVETLKSTYLKLVSAADAQRWFSIIPA